MGFKVLQSWYQSHVGLVRAKNGYFFSCWMGMVYEYIRYLFRYSYLLVVVLV